MWTFALARLAGILLAGLVRGLLIGPIWLWLLGTACLYLGWQLLNLHRLDRWLRLRSQIDPPNLGGIWGDVIGQVVRLHRRKQFHKQRLVQLFRELRRSTAALPDGVIILSSQHEIVWFNRQAARLLGLKRPIDIGLRIDNLIRSPEFVHYLHGEDFAVPLVIRPPVHAELHPGAAAGALRRRPVAAAGARRHPADAPGGDAQGLRGECLARAAHAADRDLRLPRHAGGGPRHRPGLGGPDPRHARAGAAHERHHRGSAGAVAPGVHRRRGAARTDRRAAACSSGCTATRWRRANRPRQVSLDLESEDGLFGSAQEIESAFTNLLVNGIKYTMSDGTVRMRWWTDEDGAYFSVIDTGIGIPAEHIPRLTERFYRVDAGRSRDRGGSGLGLAIVKHALQRHGGWLDVQSVEGKGSTFTCHFPPQRVWHGGAVAQQRVRSVTFIVQAIDGPVDRL